MHRSCTADNQKIELGLANAISNKKTKNRKLAHSKPGSLKTWLTQNLAHSKPGSLKTWPNCDIGIDHVLAYTTTVVAKIDILSLISKRVL